jgi:hydrogenase maturation protease
MGDEGVGVHVVQRLKSAELPTSVIVLEGGTQFWGDETELDGAQKLIIIDAVVGGGAPGTIYRFGIEDLEDEAQDVKLSCHDVGLIEKLRLIQLGGHTPEQIVIIGVEPARVAWNTNLSEDVEARIPEIIESVMAEITC